jgi:hypothetical protein
MLARISAGSALLAIFGIAEYWSLRVAWAGHLAPENAESHLRLAASLGQSGADPRPELEQAAALKPDDHRIWLRLAREQEARGDLKATERCLLRAAETSRQFAPRWGLTNFYCRHPDSERFWHWARDALAMAYDDPTPLYRLCRQMPEADDGIERILPDQPRKLAAYLRLLAAENDLARGERVARKLLPVARAEDLPDLLAFCDRSLLALQPDPALRIWNGLGVRGLAPYSGTFLTNGDFSREPIGGGFDWRVASSLPGVTASRMGGGGLHITFSGREPENCELLAQWIPPGVGDRCVRLEYRTSGIAPSSGVRWAVVDAASGKEIAGVPLSSDVWTWTNVRLPPRLSRIVLSYRRVSGVTRVEGSVELRKVQS